MNLLRRPELMDRLAASYALGTLRGGARRRFEALARRSPPLRVAAQVWQERFMAMTELQHAEAPDPNVWKRIENVVASERAPAGSASTKRVAPDLLQRALKWWRAGALAATAVAIAAIAVTLKLQSQPEVRYVAVLMDEKATPMLLATYDPKHDVLVVKRMAGFHEAADKSLQLWAVPRAGIPRSLGVLPDAPLTRVPAPEDLVGQSPALAISLEPKGGVSGENGPTGPVLWKGAVLQAPI